MAAAACLWQHVGRLARDASVALPAKMPSLTKMIECRQASFGSPTNCGLPYLACCAKTLPVPSLEVALHGGTSALQNTRGGRVKLNAIVMPEMEYNHPEKGAPLLFLLLA
jgi:hypothetical protein